MPEQSAELPAALRAETVLEDPAALEHERWSRWQRHVHARCAPGDDGSLTIPAGLASRWARQMSVPYAELSEAEKESDREQVRRYLPTIASALADHDA